MGTLARNKALAREFFARFSSGDIARAVDLLSDDATWWLPGKEGSKQTAGLYKKAEITELFLRMMSRLEGGLYMQVKGAVAEGDAVALEVESHGTLTSGRIYNNEYHILMRISGDKIREVREYNDTQHAQAVWFAP